ncbi:MAG: undecaprenyldiphospho-muramoylpentapeptide beta-N-acetylglucosaminyltransferase [Bacilli bacterium]|jgi:UDP-N-acetylglucosamine--N-acetylmuramyl-(pentapeptide) pyrophosphoryl-undecaprenol N-acetylglucosamine transferase|nr:undecaprenyldiphospho-muramoylpentapeptide beta-N-acetylglucosaminyltransferase [Bacilli bacterium]
MRVIISAGGTGGHIYPAIAIINKIKEMEPNSEFLYIGTHNRMEKDIVPNFGIPFKSIEIYGLNRKELLKNVKVIKCLLNSFKECKKIIKEFNPDVVIGVGGYVTAPVIYTAKKLGYKTFIHEQNSVSGASNKFLVRYSDLIGVSFKSSLKDFPKDKVIFTGNPVSENALKAPIAKKKDYKLSENKKLVLIVMGSLGSSKINDFFVKTLNKFKDKNYEIMFVTGKDMYEEVNKNKFPKNVFVVPYVNELASLLKRTDLIISRAGASTLAEIISLGIPSILIPSPYVTNNHQYKNALDLKNIDACTLIEEKDLEEELLINEIDKILNNESRIKEIKKNLKKISCDDSQTIIYNNIKKLIAR